MRSRAGERPEQRPSNEAVHEGRLRDVTNGPGSATTSPATIGPMRTLVLGRPSARRIRLQKLLDGAGGHVDVCHDGDWGCVGMDGGCPLDEQDIDVAVAVAEPGAPFDAQGVACVYRARIPIVAVGARMSDPVREYATVNVDQVDDETVETIRQASQDVTGHVAAVEAELAERLSDGEHVDVTVRRLPNTIEVVLVGELAPQRVATLTDVARAAIREYDGRVAVINVSAATP